MSKFETVNTLMYKCLIEELEYDIELSEQRLEWLRKEEDFESAKHEVKRLLKWQEKLKHLKSYLKEEGTCSAPHSLQIISHNKFDESRVKEYHYTNQLDDSQYYYNPSGIKLNDWKRFDENLVYIISNLWLRVTSDGKLISKYPQELMWHPLDSSSESDKVIFDAYGNKEVFIKGEV